jgi:hypothetical protein
VSVALSAATRTHIALLAREFAEELAQKRERTEPLSGKVLFEATSPPVSFRDSLSPKTTPTKRRIDHDDDDDDDVIVLDVEPKSVTKNAANNNNNDDDDATEEAPFVVGTAKPTSAAAPTKKGAKKAKTAAHAVDFVPNTCTCACGR